MDIFERPFYLVVYLIIATLIGAKILRAAIAWYNRRAHRAGSTTSVPEPLINRARVMVFIIVCVNMFVGWMMNNAAGSPVVVVVMTMLTTVLIDAGLLAAMLPTRFGPAFRIMVQVYLILLAIGSALLLFVTVLRYIPSSS
ncbi:MAG: hypothetical protein KBE65_18825 [Phycisphaerae bacterium]|nr:hypothetical protein [Phycisphaerae bacterium]